MKFDVFRARLAPLVALLAILFAAQMPVLAIAAGGLPGMKASSGSSANRETNLDAFLDQARKDGATVIVVKPPEPEKASDESMGLGMTMSSDNLLRARSRIGMMIHDTGLFLAALPAILKAAGPDGSLYWIGRSIVTAVVGLMLGTIVFRATTRWGREHFRYVFNPEEKRRSRKLGYLLGRAGWILVSTAIMFVTAVLVAVIFDYGSEPSRQTIFVIISTYAIYKILRYVIFFNFFAPDVPSHRLINLSDEAALRLYRHWIVVLAVSTFIIGIIRWVQELKLNDDAQRLGFIVGMFICAAMLIGMSIMQRRELVQILLGPGNPETKPQWKHVLALSALPIIVVYLAFSWFMSSLRLTLGMPGGYLLVGAPILVFVAALFVYGIAIFLLEIIYEARAVAYRRNQILKSLAENRAWRRAEAAKEIAAGRSEDERDLLEEGEEMTINRPMDRPRERPREFRPAFKGFFENAILAIVLVVSAGALARLWGIDISRPGHPLAAALDILLVMFLAASSYKAINSYIDDKILEEGGSLDDQPQNPGDGDAETGRGQSRLATLLPVFRNVIIAAIGIFAFTFAISYLGVNVAPLFAGAGVVGIAIGFGAQTLIRDIFSGAFFLIDDAFRKGEYIELDKVKGTVEKISMRSFQLRHHLGALHTVPFGEIHHLTNYSRDWVMMKLPLRLTYDTDVEKVRKLIKKLGQQLLEDPVIGPLFLQPLKSQGVYAMEDSAMIIRVKYMTRPGDQFVTRKVIYAAIREIFQQEGIRFAHREVTVRLADGQKVENLTPAEREAVAGSVRAVIDEEGRKRLPDSSKAAAAAL